MKIATYQKLKAEYAAQGRDFDEEHVYVQPIDELIWDKVTSQIRKNGHVVQKAKEMASDLKVNGQKAPTSTKTDPQGNKVLREGATRVLGAIENGDKEILANDWLDSQGWNEQQIYDWQCSQNEHDTQTSNTSDDIKSQVQYRYDQGWIDAKVGFSYNSNPAKYVDDAVKYLRTVYKTLTSATVKTYIAKALEKEIGANYENYTKTTAMDKFENQLRNLGINWNPDKAGSGMIGEVDNGKTFYAAAKTGEFKTNFAGNVTWKPDGTTAGIVAWKGDLLGASPAKIFKFYEKMIKLYKDYKNKSDWHDSVLGGGLFAAPQIKTGTYKQDMNKMIDLLKWTNPIPKDED